MADFAALSTAANYASLLTSISDRDRDLARGLDPAYVTLSNPPTGTVRMNSANKRWERYDGSAFVELVASATDAYNITVTGLRDGAIWGAITNNGTITGGAINVSSLQLGGSPVWSTATLTNLNQLTNGPGFITSGALASYAPLASPALTGTPSAPTAAVDTSTTQLATTAYVVGQGYLKSSAAASTYAALAGATFVGDITTYRSGTPTIGVLYLGNTGARYLSFDGSAYNLPGGGLVVNGQVALHAGNFNTYSPTLSGTGATGSWGISVTGSAGSVAWTSVTGRPTALSAFTNDINSTITPSWTNVSGRPTALSAFTNDINSTIAPAWSNVTGRPTAVSTWTNDSGYITSAALSGYATTAAVASTYAPLASPSFTGTVTCAGQVRGNGGSKGLGAITTTTTTGTPTGGADGDLVFVY